MRRHDWVVNVLGDMADYFNLNGLPVLADKVKDARAEIVDQLGSRRSVVDGQVNSDLEEKATVDNVIRMPTHMAPLYDRTYKKDTTQF
jgi:hypothetical protein